MSLLSFRPVEVRVFELKLARPDADVVPLLLLGVEAAKAVHDHRALDGKAERVSRGERECLAGVDHRGDGDAAASYVSVVELGLYESTMKMYSEPAEKSVPTMDSNFRLTTPRGDPGPKFRSYAFKRQTESPF